MIITNDQKSDHMMNESSTINHNQHRQPMLTIAVVMNMFVLGPFSSYELYTKIKDRTYPCNAG